MATMDANAIFIDTNALVYAGGKQVHDTNTVATILAYDIPCLLTQYANIT